MCLLSVFLRQVSSIRDLPTGASRAKALYPGFQSAGCVSCNTPGHICNQMGAASQSLEEMAFERGLWLAFKLISALILKRGATMSGNLVKVKEMLLGGANPNQPDTYGFSALHYACTEGFYDICLTLLEHKSNPNAQTLSSQVYSHLSFLIIRLHHFTERLIVVTYPL